MSNIVGKSELLQRLRQGKAAIDRALAALTAEQMTAPNTVGEWSVKDMIAHFAAHEQRALGGLRAAMRGTPIPPDPDSDELNSKAVEAARWQSLEAVRADWERSFQELVMTVELLPNDAFNPFGGIPQALGDSVDGALANNSYAHYAEHLEHVRILAG